MFPSLKSCKVVDVTWLFFSLFACNINKVQEIIKFKSKRDFSKQIQKSAFLSSLEYLFRKESLYSCHFKNMVLSHA